MKKENIKYTAILVAFAISVVFFASLAKKIEEEKNAETTSTTAADTEESTSYETSEFITEEVMLSDGFVKIAEGETRELVTDENGITVADENGNLIYKDTDEQGNEVTGSITFPDFLVEGNQMSCQQFKIICPEGWENTSDRNFILKSTVDDKSINYSFSAIDDENYKDIDESIAELEKIFETMIQDGSVTITKSTTQIAGRDAIRLVMEMNGDEPSYMDNYYVETANGTMCFACSCDPKDKGFDFKAILDTIEYRIK